MVRTGEGRWGWRDHTSVWMCDILRELYIYIYITAWLPSNKPPSRSSCSSMPPLLSGLKCLSSELSWGSDSGLSTVGRWPLQNATRPAGMSGGGHNLNFSIQILVQRPHILKTNVAKRRHEERSVSQGKNYFIACSIQTRILNASHDTYCLHGWLEQIAGPQLYTQRPWT